MGFVGGTIFLFCVPMPSRLTCRPPYSRCTAICGRCWPIFTCRCLSLSFFSSSSSSSAASFSHRVSRGKKADTVPTDAGGRARTTVSCVSRRSDTDTVMTRSQRGIYGREDCAEWDIPTCCSSSIYRKSKKRKRKNTHLRCHQIATQRAQ